MFCKDTLPNVNKHIMYYIIFQSYDETRVDEEDADNAIIPYSPSESILVLFVVSTGNFGDFVGGIPGTNHSAIGHVIQCNTSYMNY